MKIIVQKNIEYGKEVQKELRTHYPQHFVESGGTRTEALHDKSINGFRISFQKNSAVLRYSDISSLMRGLGTLISLPEGYQEETVSPPPIEFRGIMIDCSRNAVLNISFLKKLIALLGLCGINCLTLYTEDTVSVKGEDLLGYKRGRYSDKELKDLSAYAEKFGIEMFPCIQTLGHMEQLLQYKQAKAGITDTPRVLSIKSKETYKLIENVIRSASAPFSSNLIHIGMDETQGLGQGKYFDPDNPEKPIDLYVAHLKKVSAICKENGLSPIMWADILMGVSDTEQKASEELTNEIPKNVTLDYWDYYSHTPDKYKKGIDTYRKAGFEPIVSPGLWNWGNFWAGYPKAMSTMPLFMKAAREKNIKKSLATMWGDDGQEAPFFSALPQLFVYAENCWSESPSPEDVSARFEALTGDPIEFFALASKLDYPSFKCAPGKFSSVSKGFFYEDPLYGLFSSHDMRKRTGAHFRELSEQFSEITDASDKSNSIYFRYVRDFSGILSDKADLYRELYSAYNKKDRKKLKEISESTLPSLSRKIAKFSELREKIWMLENKP
ncbi:MAG: family 20 glycosylhydrolase, partial [Fibrobacterota bacterium]